MFSADQIVAHLVGDYILQSDWMAVNKTKRFSIAVVHAMAYSLPFMLFELSAGAWFLILLPHAIIDRYGLARYVVWAKEQDRWR